MPDDDVEAKLHNTTDATAWADEFLKLPSTRIVGDDGEINRGLMIAWFANALETGRTHGGKMTLERFEDIAEAALANPGATGRTVAGVFLADVSNMKKSDVEVLGNVIALVVGCRGHIPAADTPEAIFRQAADAAMKVLVERGHFTDLKAVARPA